MLTSYRDKKIVHLLLTRLPCGFRQEKKKLADELGSQARNLYFKFIYYFKPILVDVLHEGPPHNPSANQPSIAGSCAPHGEIVYRYLQSRSSTRKAFVPWLQVAAAAPALLLASAPLRPCSAPAPLPAPPRCCPRAERPPLRPPRLLGPDSARPVGDFAAPRDSRGSSAAASASPVSLCAFSRRHSALWPSSASFQCSSWCSCGLHQGTMVTIRFPNTAWLRPEAMVAACHARTWQQYITELQPLQCFSFAPCAWLRSQDGSAHTSRLNASSGAASASIPRASSKFPRK